MFVIGRFNFTWNTCSNIYNGNMHRELDSDRSVATEIINAIFDEGTSHFTYLDGTNVISFMKVLFAYLNVSETIKDRLRKGDLEDVDIAQRYRDFFPCCCDECKSGSETHAGVGLSVFTSRNELVQLPVLDYDDDGNEYEEGENSGKEGT